MEEKKPPLRKKIWNWRFPVRNRLTTALGLLCLAAAIVLYLVYYVF